MAQTIDTAMQQYTLKGARIRRLTPVECERLQGFPDGWTEGISDSQRYKCLGNAVTVNVITAVISEMFFKHPHPPVKRRVLQKENDMSQEAQLERIANALETLIAMQGGKVEKPMTAVPSADPLALAPEPPKAGKTRKAVATAPEPQAPPALVAGVAKTAEDVLDALRVVVDKAGSDKAREILSKYGAKKVSEVREQDRAAVWTELTNLVK